jgi:putative transposase
VPAHVTMRAVRGVPSFRTQRVAALIVAEIARASGDGFRVIDHSVQDNHLHLLAEGDDGEAFSRGMQRLASRIAMALNALVRRHGRVWRERYHRRDLRTPRQFRNAMVYVLMNFRKHASPSERAARARKLDVYSSALWMDDWKDDALRAMLREHRARAGPRPTAAPRTWIARVGWKRHGLLDLHESPRSPG